MLGVLPLSLLAWTSRLPRRDVGLIAACLAPACLAPGGGAASVGLATDPTFPAATFGVQIYDDETARALTRLALEAGFRSFFASIESGNQRGFAAAIRESGIARSELFVAGSVLSDAARDEREAFALTASGCAENARNMEDGVGPLDMLLLEYPGRTPAAVRGQWRAMEAAKAAGLTRAVGVSNFALRDLDTILADARTTTRPAVNQVCYSLAFGFPYPELRSEHAARRVPLQAWSPLGGPAGLIDADTLELCAQIGRRRRASAQQVALRWVSQRGVGFAVHSRSPRHLRDDLASLAFDLAPSELEALDARANRPRLPEVAL